jgi:uncharacterized protein
MSEGRTLVPGTAEGRALVLTEPLSFWGGIDAATGRLIDVHHPQRGITVAGRVLVMPHGRGSSSSSSVLAEAIRAGTGPAAVVMLEGDPIVALGAIVVGELYGRWVPVVVLDASSYGAIGDGDVVAVRADRAGARVEPA